MIILELAFWATVALLLYLHGGYAVILAVLSRFREAPTPGESRPTSWPSVTVLVGAYNEASIIADKLDSLLGQDYPGQLDIVVISDRSTDSTEEIVKRHEERGVRLIVPPRRSGKAANFSELIPTLETEFLVLTDAGGILAPDAVRRLMARFEDPATGCVGARIVYRNVDVTGVSRGEGLYWRYEVLLRTLESRLGGTVIVSGGCYAVRRCLFRPVPAELPDDFMSPLNVWDQGSCVIYEPDALVRETVAETLGGEFRTKVRIISRNFSALRRMRHLLNPFRRPILAWKLWSHRLLRWLVVPMLVLTLALNLLLLSKSAYQVLLALQLSIYAAAALGLIPAFRRLKVFWIPLYFCLVNLAAIVGVWHGLTDQISGTWEPVERGQQG